MVLSWVFTLKRAEGRLTLWVRGDLADSEAEEGTAAKRPSPERPDRRTRRPRGRIRAGRRRDGRRRLRRIGTGRPRQGGELRPAMARPGRAGRAPVRR